MASSLTGLPAEIRSAIYQFLFPNIYLPVRPLIIEIFWSVHPANDHGRRKCYKPPHSTTLYSKLPIAANLMLTSRFLHHEVSQILHASSILDFFYLDNFTTYIASLTPYTRQLTRRLKVSMAKSSTMERHLLMEGWKRMTGLHELTLTYCDIYTDMKHGGVQWKAYVLQNLKAVEKACSCLKYTYHRVIGDCIRMKTNDSNPAGYVKFDVEEESEKREARVQADNVPRAQQDPIRMMNKTLDGRRRRMF